jgi:hypothetical protein
MSDQGTVTQPTEPTAPVEPPPAEPAGDPDALGDPGKKALDAMKAERNQFRSESREWKQLAKELGVDDAAGLKDLILNAGKPKDAPKSEPAPKGEQVDVEQVRREATLEATRAANERILRSEVKAAAAGKLADPADAYKFLDLSKFDITDTGDIDAEEIADAIDTLIKTKPYLAAATANKWQGSADGGARNGPAGPQQLTRDDLKGMTPEAVMAAKKAGQLKNLLAT